MDLLASWGIFPHAITGHSSGEVAGAYAAGAISREAAWKVAYFRGKLSSKLIRSGSLPQTSMAAVGLDTKATWAAIERVNQMGDEGTLEIACMNSWQSHTVSGDAQKINTLVEMLNQDKVFARKLNVEIAYHSQYMKAIAEEYLEAMGELEAGTYHGQRKPTFFSSTRGSSISLAELRKPSYWVANLVSPVRFCESVTELLKDSVDEPKVNGFTKTKSAPSALITDILEIGPHAALKGPLANISKQISGRDAISYHSLLKRKSSAVQTALETAGSLFCQGYEVDLPAVNEAGGLDGRKPLMLIDLPSYPFNHSKEYWLESRLSKNFRLRPTARHDLLGVPIADWNKSNATWRNYIRMSENPWIEDHKVSGDVLYPAAGMLVMAIEASRQITDDSRVLNGFRFKDVSFHLALRVPDDAQGVETHFYLRPYRETSSPGSSTWNEFQLWSFNDGEWREHCRGLVQSEFKGDKTDDESMVREQCRKAVHDAQQACTADIAVEKVYRKLKQSGLDFGPTFRTLANIRLGQDRTLLAQVNSPLSKIREIMPSHYVQPHLVHPALLDGVVHANIAPLVSNSLGSDQPRVPVYAESIWISARPESHDAYMVVTAQPSARGEDEIESSFTAISPKTSLPSVYASGLVFKTLPGGESQDAAQSLHDAFNIEWKPDPSLLSDKQASKVFGVPMTAEDNPSDWMEDCEALCLAYIRRFLASVTEDRVGRMAEHHLKYVSWMEYIARQMNDRAVPGIEVLEDRVRSKATPEGVLIIAVGQALDEMLGGPLNPLDVIFKDKIAENVYRYGLGSQRCYEQLCGYVDALAHKNPAMQILEIGAGTGGATRPVMETLTAQGRQYENYCFTDISPSFFEQAKDTIFKDQLESADFRVLNVENDPVEQGFEAGRYDLVLAANVLHATKKIDVSLSNTKRLLKPGGKLLLFEITNIEVLLSHFCFGTLPGWWLSEDKDRRWGPLMSAESWRHHLSQSGFTGLDAVFQDFPGSAHQMSSILVSSVPAHNAAIYTVGTTYIVTDGLSAQQVDVARHMSKALVGNGSVCNVTSLMALDEKDLNGTTCVVLAELKSSLFQDMTDSVFASIKRMTSQCASLLWVTKGGDVLAPAPDMELVTGLARVARSERPGFQFKTLSFEQNEAPGVLVQQCVQALSSLGNDKENSFRVIKGIPHVPRLVKAKYLADHIRSQTAALGVVQNPLGKEASRSLALRVGKPGQIDSLRFEDDPVYETPLTADEVEFQNMASGLNSLDLASMMGQVRDVPLGLEASGIVTRTGPASKFQIGDRVFGLALTGALKTHVRSSDGLLAKLPDRISWSEAASIPVAYTTAYSVLHEMGSVRKGDKVLVHTGANSLAQAAVQLAQLAGAEVLVSTDGEVERSFFATTCGVPQDHILSARNASLKAVVDQMTHGRGVDTVLNNLGSDSLSELVACVASFGRLVDLVPVGSNANARISLGDLQKKNIRYETYDLRYRALHDPLRTQRSFQGMVEQLSLRGPESTIQRTSISTYAFSQIPDVFRQMQSGTHTKKLVLEPHDQDIVPVLSRRIATCRLEPNATYVIAGGLGGLGRSVARWMAGRGAKNLILLSRRGAVQDAAKRLVQELELTCDRIATPACDVTDSEALRDAIEKCLEKMPPVRGCIQGSMVLKVRSPLDLLHDAC